MWNEPLSPNCVSASGAASDYCEERGGAGVLLDRPPFGEMCVRRHFQVAQALLRGRTVVRTAGRERPLTNPSSLCLFLIHERVIAPVQKMLRHPVYLLFKGSALLV